MKQAGLPRLVMQKLQNDDVMDVVRILPDVLFRCFKGDDGKIYWSLNEGGLAEEFGLTTDEIRGKSLHELFPGGASPELEEHFELAFQGISTIFTNQIGDRHFRHYPKPIMDDDGNVVEVVGYIAEVTDLINTQKELEAANQELDAFAHTVSHDLRNPLTVLSTIAQVLNDQYKTELDATGRNYLQKMQRTVKQMHTMAEALLDLSTARNKELEKRTVNLSEIAHDVAQALQTSDPKRNVTFDLQPSIVAKADPGLMRVLLQNLISNAWKYAGEAPRIEFKLESTEQGPAYVVRDNGPGFPKEQAQALFRAFQRAHDDHIEGTGIGLSTVARIVARHGGHAWATSDGGAAFWFTLP